MELKEIKEIIELVSEKGFTEFELQKGGFKLRICSLASQETTDAPAAKPQSEVVKAEVAPSVEKPVVKEAPPKVKSDQELHKVKSPIVGTFYRSPSPTADPFVKVGSSVKQGTVLCIIEAMKLMNEIESDIVGEIVEIYVENSQPVEYGQPLFGVKVN